jgi:cell division transport system permease protein
MSRPTGLASARSSLRARTRRHLYSLFSSLGSLLEHRLGTLMTVLVLGVAMALPLALHLAVLNLNALDFNKQRLGSLSVFLSPGIGEPEVTDLIQRIEVTHGGRVETISPEQGMEDFKAASGFQAAMELFDENPLPWVLQVTPADDSGSELDESAERVVSWLREQPGVDWVQADFKWMERLEGLVGLGEALVRVLAFVLALTVVMVIANTIRLDVANRSGEIQVLHLVGAPDGFIRQPFLYAGFWYGVLGALLALLLLSLVLFYLHGPMERLLDAYGNVMRPRGLGPREVAAVLLCGGLLGLIGSWLAVRGHLRGLRLEKMPVRG